MIALTPAGWLVAAMIIAAVCLALFVGYLLNTPPAPPAPVEPPDDDREPHYMIAVDPRQRQQEIWLRHNGNGTNPAGRTDNDRHR